MHRLFEDGEAAERGAEVMDPNTDSCDPDNCEQESTLEEEEVLAGLLDIGETGNL